MPFVVADHFTQLCSTFFPDSKIASKFACKCTKCTQIIKRAIAPSLEDKVVQICMECYEYCRDSEVLKKAKTACIDYNNELKK